MALSVDRPPRVFFVQLLCALLPRRGFHAAVWIGAKCAA